MRAVAWFSQEDSGLQHVLGAGDIIGRAGSAALRFDDPRVSEAHALLSLRGRSLWLLALRGRMLVGGRVVAEWEIVPGQRIELAPGLALVCDAIELPDHVLGLRAPGLGTQVLLGTTSLLAGPPPSLRPGLVAGADIAFWTFGAEWRAQPRGEELQPVTEGQSFSLGTTTVDVVAIPVEEASSGKTQPSLRPGLIFEALHQHVRVCGPAIPAADVTGVPGRILATLLRAGRPLPWRELCSAVWPNDRARESSLRNRVDVGLARLRERLRELGATELAVALDGSGCVRIRLTSADSVRLVDGR